MFLGASQVKLFYFIPFGRKRLLKPVEKPCQTGPYKPFRLQSSYYFCIFITIPQMNSWPNWGWVCRWHLELLIWWWLDQAPRNIFVAAIPVTKNIPLTNNSNIIKGKTRKKQRKGPPPAAPPKTASSSAAVHISQLSSLNKKQRVLLFGASCLVPTLSLTTSF